MIAPTLGKLWMHQRDGTVRQQWLWVVGPDGVVSTWFSDTSIILGHSVCDGPTLHSRSPFPHGAHAHQCDFIRDADCWCARETMMEAPAMVKHYDMGNLEAVYQWLANWYITMRSEIER